MFWSGNFMAVRELNFLLKEENVTLASVLEADDILQECKADNKALIQFLTRPDILAELITLITEEPPKNVELSQQYRHASIACEVLTSHLSTLSDRLTLDTAQMNRLCDFINKDPPLNPLLASYFSKTVEMLLERSPKQDWYLYHIVCLRVLDFFKSRRDFLPNLLRHIATSAIADTFKYLIRLDDLFNKPIMEWLEQHQFIDSLIGIICGSYLPEPCPPQPCPPDAPEKGQRETSEKEYNDNAPMQLNNSYDICESSAQSSSESPNRNSYPPGPPPAGCLGAAQAERMASVAADNAAALLCELVATGCASESACGRSRTAWQLGGALGAAATVRALLCSVFTSAPRRRPLALHHAARLLLQLLHHHTSRNENGECLRGVELAVAPHLPLLHQALLRVAPYTDESGGTAESGDAGRGAARAQRVGAARVSTAALIAQLALSEVEEVASTLLTLGTPGVLIELMFEFPENNFLHAQVVAFCRNALSNRLYRLQYARHLFLECDLLTRLMDAFRENEIHTLVGRPRAGYMGHVVVLLGWCGAALGSLDSLAEEGAPPTAVQQRLARLQEDHLAAILHRHDTPLGGSYPSENMYDTGEEMENISDTLAANYDELSNMATSEKDDYYAAEMSNAVEHGDSAEFVADGLGLHEAGDSLTKAQNTFLELASQRFDDDMWEDTPEPEDFSQSVCTWGAPAWESDSVSTAPGGEGWAQFDAFTAPPPAFAAPPAEDPYAPYWNESRPQEGDPAGLCSGLRALGLEAGGAGRGAELDSSLLEAAGSAELANNLLTAMSGMTPAAIANIVNANLQPLPIHTEVLPSESADPSAPAPVTPPAQFGNAPAQLTSEPSAEPLLPVPSEPSAVPLPCVPSGLTLPTEVSLPNEVTVPAEVTSPKQVPLPAEVSLSAEITLPKEVTLSAEVTKEITLPTEETLPHDLKVEFPDSSSSDPPVKVNCVTPVKEIVVESISSEIVKDGEVNDLPDKVSEVTDIAIDTAVEATEATESAVEVTEASER